MVGWGEIMSTISKKGKKSKKGKSVSLFTLFA